jgi:predicted transcriptional regulator
MADLLRWRKRNGLTQVGAASLLGVSQTYLSLLKKRCAPLDGRIAESDEDFRGHGSARVVG